MTSDKKPDSSMLRTRESALHHSGVYYRNAHEDMPTAINAKAKSIVCHSSY